VPVVVDLPNTWQRVEMGPDRLALTNGPDIFMAMNLGTNPTDEFIAKVMPQAAGAMKMRLGKRQGNDWPISSPEAGVGRVRILPCPEIQRTLMIMVIVDDEKKDAEAARRILDKARCRRPDEPAQPWRQQGAPASDI
jgi:hypothetical protein